MRKTDLNRTFSRTIKEIRKKWSMTSENCSKKMGIGKTTLLNIEQGKANPTLGTIQNIADNLQVDPISLLDDAYGPHRIENTLALMFMECLDTGYTVSLDSMQRALDHVQLAIEILMEPQLTPEILESLHPDEDESLCR